MDLHGSDQHIGFVLINPQIFLEKPDKVVPLVYRTVYVHQYGSVLIGVEQDIYNAISFAELFEIYIEVVNLAACTDKSGVIVENRAAGFFDR